MKRNISDSEIIELFFDRKEEAIEETRNKYENYLTAISNRILRDDEDVKECVSDTYLGAWNTIPPTRPTVLRVFLGRITRNLSLKKLRALTAEKRGGGESDLTLDELVDVIPDGTRIDEHLELQELTGYIEEYLESKSSEDRILFLRRYWYFDSISEIASSYGLGESAVKMRLKRMRDELQDFLSKRGIIESI